jgi:dipeptidyl aminopeptidase/acylaminoacyl peptidase
MKTKKVLPYGLWESPFTSDIIAGGSIGLDEISIDGDDIYWLESRPAEGGRKVIVSRDAGGAVHEKLPGPFNARTKVHEYGGGSYIAGRGVIYFVNFLDQRIYKQPPGGEPAALTEESGKRFADFTMDKKRNRLICVCEDHCVSERGGRQEAVNTIAGVGCESGEISILARGHDFYSSPRISPDGNKLAFIGWDHPDMPWDSSILYICGIGQDGGLSEPEIAAGGAACESIFQPEWSADGNLFYASDRTGWWNLYRHVREAPEPLLPMEAEFGTPQWAFAESLYSFQPPSAIVAAFNRGGLWQIACIDAGKGGFKIIQTPDTLISSLHVKGFHVYYIGGTPLEAPAVKRLDLNTGELVILRESTAPSAGPEMISVPEAVDYPTGNGQTAHAWFYPPASGLFKAPEGELPPLLVKIHGGPTSAASPVLNLSKQYWTSRGYAVLDVNYRGSTGFGRDYRKLLEKNWGIADVEDCVRGAEYLAGRGLADRNRMAISGGSAGGFTTLAALTFHHGVFRTGASYYGVSSLENLARDTHKFESRYLDRLVGKYPQEKSLYMARSPVDHIEKLDCPVIFFQGLEDKIVPPDQAEKMVRALEKKGITAEYHPFAGEGHGFRKAENIKTALDRELAFYNKVLRISRET